MHITDSWFSTDPKLLKAQLSGYHTLEFQETYCGHAFFGSLVFMFVIVVLNIVDPFVAVLPLIAALVVYGGIASYATVSRFCGAICCMVATLLVAYGVLFMQPDMPRHGAAKGAWLAAALVFGAYGRALRVVWWRRQRLDEVRIGRRLRARKDIVRLGRFSDDDPSDP